MDEERKEKLRELTRKEVEDLMNSLKNCLDLGVSKGGFSIEEIVQVHQFLYGLVTYLNKAVFPESDEKRSPASEEEVRKHVQGLYSAIQKSAKNGGYSLDVGASVFTVFETLRQFFEVHLEDSK